MGSFKTVFYLLNGYYILVPLQISSGGMDRRKTKVRWSLAWSFGRFIPPIGWRARERGRFWCFKRLSYVPRTIRYQFRWLRCQHAPAPVQGSRRTGGGACLTPDSESPENFDLAYIAQRAPPLVLPTVILAFFQPFLLFLYPRATTMAVSAAFRGEYRPNGGK